MAFNVNRTQVHISSNGKWTPYEHVPLSQPLPYKMVVERMDGSLFTIPVGTIITKETVSHDQRLLIKKMVIPEGVLKIDDNALLGSSVSMITFPSSLETIGSLGLGECKYLNESDLTIPPHARVHRYAFFKTNSK